MNNLIGWIWIFPLWLFMDFLSAQFGWNRLRVFESVKQPSSQVFSMQSARIDRQRYRSSLTIIVAETGLYLRPVWLFRLFRAPLFVPWTAFDSFSTENNLFGEATQLSICTSEQQSVPLQLDSQASRAAVAKAIRKARTSNSNSLR